MPVKTIILVRHGLRLTYCVDPRSGAYSSPHRHPTNLPADPPLTAHGARQAEETAVYLEQELSGPAREGLLCLYSSPFYRCLETIGPTIERLRRHAPSLRVRPERGIGEWFGKAWFEQPAPADCARLRKDFFSWLDDGYASKVVPDRDGERIEELHDRVAAALDAIVRDVDAEFDTAGRAHEQVTVLLCGHAAQIIATGRVLTGCMPENASTDDFRCFTCGISRFTRRPGPAVTADTNCWQEWRERGGVAGGWDLVQNSSCTHLSKGEERGWHFQGDESFDSYGGRLLRGGTGIARAAGSDGSKL